MGWVDDVEQPAYKSADAPYDIIVPEGEDPDKYIENIATKKVQWVDDPDPVQATPQGTWVDDPDPVTPPAPVSRFGAVTDILKSIPEKLSKLDTTVENYLSKSPTLSSIYYGGDETQPTTKESAGNEPVRGSFGGWLKSGSDQSAKFNQNNRPINLTDYKPKVAEPWKEPLTDVYTGESILKPRTQAIWQGDVSEPDQLDSDKPTELRGYNMTADDWKDQAIVLEQRKETIAKLPPEQQQAEIYRLNKDIARYNEANAAWATEETNFESEVQRLKAAREAIRTKEDMDAYNKRLEGLQFKANAMANRGDLPPHQSSILQDILGIDHIKAEEVRRGRELARQQVKDVITDVPTQELEMAAKGVGNAWLLGLPKTYQTAQGEDWREPETTREQIATGAGDLIGFITGPAGKIVSGSTKVLTSAFPRLGILGSDKLGTRAVKGVLSEAVPLGAGTASLIIGDMLSQQNLEDAIKVGEEGFKGGLAMGGTFGVLKGIFPGASNLIQKLGLREYEKQSLAEEYAALKKTPTSKLAPGSPEMQQLAARSNEVISKLKILNRTEGSSQIINKAKYLAERKEQLQRIQRIALGVATMEAERGTTPWDDRPLQKKIMDIGLDIYFLWNGVHYTKRSDMLKAFENSLVNRVKNATNMSGLKGVLDQEKLPIVPPVTSPELRNMTESASYSEWLRGTQPNRQFIENEGDLSQKIDEAHMVGVRQNVPKYVGEPNIFMAKEALAKTEAATDQVGKELTDRMTGDQDWSTEIDNATKNQFAPPLDINKASPDQVIAMLKDQKINMSDIDRMRFETLQDKPAFQMDGNDRIFINELKRALLDGKEWEPSKVDERQQGLFTNEEYAGPRPSGKKAEQETVASNVETVSKKQSIGEVKKIKSFTTDEGKFSSYDVINDPRDRANMFTVKEDDTGWIVRNAIIPDNVQQQGIATEFYIKMNDESLKNTGNPLQSTRPRVLMNGENVHELSDQGIKLWDSLVRKGYAEKLGEKDYRFKTKPNAGQKLTDIKVEKGSIADKYSVDTLPMEAEVKLKILDPAFKMKDAKGTVKEALEDIRSSEKIIKQLDAFIACMEAP